VFDILDDSPKAIAYREQQEQLQRKTILDYHAKLNQVFSTAEGQELLAIWTKDHIMRPTVVAGQPMEAHGIREGKATFVRDILETLDQIKNNYYQNKGE
jgi:hypothetical protein